MDYGENRPEAESRTRSMRDSIPAAGSSASGDEKQAWEQNGADEDEAYALRWNPPLPRISRGEWSRFPSFAGAAFEDADAKATDRRRDARPGKSGGTRSGSRVRLGFIPMKRISTRLSNWPKVAPETVPRRVRAGRERRIPGGGRTQAKLGKTEESAQSADDLVSADVREGEQGAGEGEGLHWARQFLGGKEDTFVKMRMVIVQKGETLDTLAERYGVSASSILRLNGLESGQLEEGQIVYIPEERKTAQ